ncbi:restriction endonuclease subunit S [Mesorhizobium sp. M0522]|uniref:restriction endonuclease subunit S n=1 Tax=Mesorhizobium sp. M0522 TaxID=2956958 RepID=UPI00333E0D1E
MAELPRGWVETNLGEVVEPVQTMHPLELSRSTFRYVDIGSIDNKSNLIVEPKTVSVGEAPSRARRLIRSGDVLFSTVRTYLKNIAMVDEALDGEITSTGIAVLRTNGGIDPRYLFHYVRSDDFIARMSRKQDGTLYPAITDKDLLASEIPLPPLAEQRRIAAKADGLLARITSSRGELNRCQVLLEKVHEQTLYAAVSGEITATWRRAGKLPEPQRVRLDDFVRDTSYGTAAKSGRSGDIPVLRMGNIKNGTLDWSDLVYTSNAPEINKYALVEGDVLFNRTNSPELVGKSAYYDGSRQAIYAGYLIRIRCSKELDPRYLTYCLNSPQGRNYSWKVKSDGVSQSNINAKKLRAFEFVLPSIREQRAIVRLLEQSLKRVNTVRREIGLAAGALESIEQQILTKAFRGELVPQDPNDEPASVLLKRINAERSGGKRMRIEASKEALPPAKKPFRSRKPRTEPMPKNRADDDVWHQPYLAGLLRMETLLEDIDLSAELGHENDAPRSAEAIARALFKKSSLEIADFYKQLAWEIQAGHILEIDGRLKAA